MVELLTEAQIADELTSRSAWRSDGDAIVRTAKLADFVQAVEAVNKIADVAEELGHHPDIDIRWDTLTISNSTHYKGGVTSADLRLADRIDAIIAAY